MYIKLQNISLSDSINPFSQPTEGTFHNVENTFKFQSGINDNMYAYAAYTLRVDGAYDIYTREVYTITNLLSDLGGL